MLWEKVPGHMSFPSNPFLLLLLLHRLLLFFFFSYLSFSPEKGRIRKGRGKMWGKWKRKYRVGAGKGRKRAAIKAIFAAYVSPLLAFHLSIQFLRGLGAGMGETMRGICFLVVVDSYAIALIPSLSLSPFSFPFPSIF